MKASVGDRILVASTRLDRGVRDGLIVEVKHPDGSPPYLVEWSDGQQGLLFPGADAHVSHAGTDSNESTKLAAAAGSTPPAKSSVPQVRSWRITIDLFDEGGETTAHAVLLTESPTRLESQATAHLRPDEVDVPEIGNEIAAARALRRLSDLLLGAAADDLSAIESRHVSLPS